MALLTVGGTLTGAAPAGADTPVHTRSAVAPDEAPSLTALAAEAARNEVLRIAKSGLPAELRTSAWNALRSTSGDAAIAAWLAPGGGYDLAKQRLRDTRTRNRLFCERVVSTHPVGFSPQVHAAARNAVKGTDNDRSVFVRTGYDQALQRDRDVRAADTAHQQEVAAKERDFVRALAATDPGAEVRVAAQWALRPGAADADVSEFFGYGWANGATLDLDGYRLRVSDGETRRHHALSLLLQKAVAAEEALKNASDVVKAKAEAQTAWGAVAAHAEEARRTWLAEQQATAAQAENWRGIAEAAKSEADGIWKNIAGPAGVNQQFWAVEGSVAAAAATYWQGMFDRAQEGENRVRPQAGLRMPQA
ncbi:hypothetical protein SJX93_04215 [Streptomyces cyaneofuscatus]|uniref:hypothetical protein n=1 Tax=Streptomyces cyaneofuscatus TaxID=66883 RepID=UPI002D76F7CB|nr:hypothetical protein [Streptomyces cyaneofuscatus]WRO08861.1 hypothetical protein SJX93_04215 [Streptomyces cyaneofuscatus]